MEAGGTTASSQFSVADMECADCAAKMEEAYFAAVSEEDIARERHKARELRRTQWWKNQLAAGQCYYCRGRFPPRELTMDHIVPVVRGGKSTRSNLAPCCKECNNQKKYLLPVEWEDYLKGMNQAD